MTIPIDELIFFRGVGITPTTLEITATSPILSTFCEKLAFSVIKRGQKIPLLSGAFVLLEEHLHIWCKAAIVADAPSGYDKFRELENHRFEVACGKSWYFIHKGVMFRSYVGQPEGNLKKKTSPGSNTPSPFVG